MPSLNSQVALPISATHSIVNRLRTNSVALCVFLCESLIDLANQGANGELFKIHKAFFFFLICGNSVVIMNTIM